jgi:hypothetical protein
MTRFVTVIAIAGYAVVWILSWSMSALLWVLTYPAEKAFRWADAGLKRHRRRAAADKTV